LLVNIYPERTDIIYEPW